jgi:hypothetical protein
MPLPNRVRPDGSLFATPERGLFYGNRGGRFHDPASQAVPERLYATRQWLCCVLAFKGRKRKLWGRGYTELFFCDEVTALAAGHRPCMECRRSDALAYRVALVEGLHLNETPLFPEIDQLLDGERRTERRKRLHRLPAETLPDGAMIQEAPGVWLALKGDAALLWSPAGYVQRQPRPKGHVDVVTPPASIAALTHGYRPHWHDSAAPLARSDFVTH